MDIKEFVKNFADQFDDIDATDFSSETDFRNNEEWSSLTSLSIIAMVDEVYNVKLTGDDIKTSKTIGDIFQKVNSKA